MYGTLIVDSPPVSHKESSEGLKQSLAKRYTGTEMYGTLIVDGPVTTPTENASPKSSWYDPLNDKEAEDLYDLFMSFS